MKRSIWAKRILLFTVIGPLAVFIFGSVVMLLWNNALAPVLNISTVTFWQALGILVLSKILFSSFGGGRRHSSWKERMQQKWNNRTPEERERFREKWKNRWWKGGHKPWDTSAGDEPVKSGA
jgi:hypothetical protein